MFVRKILSKSAGLFEDALKTVGVKGNLKAFISGCIDGAVDFMAFWGVCAYVGGIILAICGYSIRKDN